MSLQFYHPWQASAFVRKAGTPAVIQAIRDRRVTSVSVEQDGIRATVFDRGGMMTEAEIHLYADSEPREFGWSCSCEAKGPCVHAAALLVHGYVEGLLQGTDEFDLSHIPEVIRGSVAAGTTAPARQPAQQDLFSSGVEPDLFGSPAESVSDPGADSGSGDSPIERDRDAAIPPVYDFHCLLHLHDGALAVRPALAHGGHFRELSGVEASRAVLSSREEELMQDLGKTPEYRSSIVSALLQWPDVLFRRLVWMTGDSSCEAVKVLRIQAIHLELFLLEGRRDMGVRWLVKIDGRRNEVEFGDPAALRIHPELLYLFDEERRLLYFLPLDDEESAVLSQLREGGTRGLDVASFNLISNRFERIDSERITLDYEREKRPIIQGASRPFIRLYANKGGTGIQIFFRYSSGEIAWRDSRKFMEYLDGDGHTLSMLRDIRAEDAFADRVKELIQPDLIFERGIYADLFKDGPEQDFQIHQSPGEFLVNRGRSLLDDGIEVLVENRPVFSGGELQFSVESDLDMLGIQAMIQHSNGKGPVEFGPASGDYGPLVRSGDSFVLLREKDLKQLEYLSRRGMDPSGILETSPLNMVLIDRVFDDLDAAGQAMVEGIREKQRILEHGSDIPEYPQPIGLTTELRPYQVFGYRWLRFMLESGLNPCLADDMGLGKTLQTLSVIQALGEEKGISTVMVVTPVVTLANWEAEARRFTPALKTCRHGGGGRADTIEELLEYDVVFVSYQTLRNDISLFLEHSWDLVVLDEAHYIKNVQSQIYKTVRCLSSHARMSLTGTPIENSVMELFAQMDFLNPGLLGTARGFYAEFFRGIQKEGDENLLEELKELVRPFILRRTKEEVLDELPGKEIIIRYVDMDESQRAEYESVRKQIVEELDVESDNRRKGSLVFQSLLKLRQLAIHPPLADPAYRGTASAKMEALELLMADILSEDHKVLIFSQFIGSLEEISRICGQNSWKHVLLTGKTRDRADEVSRFQNDPDTRVFLLSLKAGGVGINLTAADYVIIFDPWWNPAAEQQAIDRAHRMGQTRSVSAFKLIMRDSIEEKILQLQQRKANLADEIINGGGSLLSHMSREEMMELFS